MSNHLTALLNTWSNGKADTDWVLGTVYRTEGSAYRKAGAMMLINGYGQQFGLLSGGCLEADIQRNARRVMQSGQVVMLEYDGSDEDDLSFQLGIGCGGKVYIMLQPISAENNLALDEMIEALGERRAGVYYQKINSLESRFEVDKRCANQSGIIEQREDGDWLVTPISPEPHLLVVGGGVDARPLVSIASTLGWRITLVDPRPANARAEYFQAADVILREMGESLTRYIDAEKIDAAVIMTHNLALDADALCCCQGTDLEHIALLGPRHRFAQVLDQANLVEQQLSCPVSAPAGLDIGGQLPESIALSILAECHAVLNQSQSLPSLRLAAI